jgi:hypothetical protein
VRSNVMTTIFGFASLLAGCHASTHEGADAPVVHDGDRPLDAVADGSGSSGMSNPLGLACSVTTATFAPALCPAPNPPSGSATFCYRPQWPGVTSVSVLGGFGQATDWTTPLTSLTEQGNGTWSATVPLANGSYPYIFQVKGGADGVIGATGTYAIDQLNPSFVPQPAKSPYPRSNSQLTVPQVAATIYHLTGAVQLNAEAQPCFIAVIDVGELLNGDMVLSEHGTANYVEVGADGTFDVPMANGPAELNIKYPFGLSTTYPNPMTTPATGNVRAEATIAGADMALATTDVTYATSAYAAMTPPPSSTEAEPVAFSWTLISGAASSYMSITATDIAGNDPAYTSGSGGSATTNSWDGKMNNGDMAVSGTTYYWATWQKKGIWNSESLEFAITYQ